MISVAKAQNRGVLRAGVNRVNLGVRIGDRGEFDDCVVTEARIYGMQLGDILGTASDCC